MLAALVGLSSQLALQQPRFKGGTASVLVDVVVTDSTGRPVTDLSADDFALTEDGEPREIASMELVRIPIDALPADAAETYSDIPTAHVASSDDRGRTYLIVIDSIHMSPSGAHHIPEILDQFIRTYMQPEDLAAVVRLGPKPYGSEFTSDKTRLRELVGAIDSASSTASSVRMPQPLLGPNAGMHERMLELAAKAAEYSASSSGRRTTMLLVSEGINPNVSLLSDNGEAERLAQATQRLTESALRANVSIYPIDPRGMAAVDPFAPGAGTGQWGYLRTLANDTGGTPLLGYADFRNVFERLVRATSTYYLLGFNSLSASKATGAFHSIDVHANRPGVTVTARKGWYEATPTTAPAALRLADAAPNTDIPALLRRPLPAGNLGLHLRGVGAVVKTTGKGAECAVVLEGKAEEIAPGDVNVGYRLIAADGTLAGEGTQHLVFSRPMRSDVWRWEAQLSIPTTAVQVRLAARVPSTGRAAAIYFDIDGTRPRRKALRLGDLLLASPRHSAVTAGRLPALRPWLPGPPTTDRTFEAEDTVTAFASLAGDVPDGTRLRTVMRSQGGAETLVSEHPVTRDEIAHGYVSSVPLQALRSGRYTLVVEAIAPRGSAVRRGVVIDVK
jgi:VWFA-related protein